MNPFGPWPLLVEIPPHDPMTFVVVTIVLGAAGLLAAYVRRVARHASIP